MTRQEIILAALAPAKGNHHTPVQVQKLLFLIDREIPSLVDGPFFDFQPYDYGPFDKTIYEDLMALYSDSLIEITPVNSWRTYALSDKGQEAGQKILSSLNEKAQEYISQISEFVRSLSFEQLVSAIYKAYPEMKENSVFQECG